MSMARSKEDEEGNGCAKRDDLEIISIGSLYKGPWEKKYWSSTRGKDRFPYPIGYKAVRAHDGSRCKLEIHEGSKGPLFLITAADGHSCSGQSPNIAWGRYQKKGFPRMKIWRGKRFSCNIDGAEFFGFKNPLVQRLLRELIANVGGVAEPNLLTSGSYSQSSEKALDFKFPNSSVYPDLLACLVHPRITRKRSRRAEKISSGSSFEVHNKGFQTLNMENVNDTNSGQASQKSHDSGSSLVSQALVGDQIIHSSAGASPKMLDRLEVGAVLGLSSSVAMECNVQEPAFAKGTVGEDKDLDNLNWSSERTDLDSVDQDVAKSMMTVLLPQALPLLKEASRKKRKAKQAVANSKYAQAEKEANMPAPDVDFASIDRSGGCSNAVAPDSFEDKSADFNTCGNFCGDEKHELCSDKAQGNGRDSGDAFNSGSPHKRLPPEWIDMSTDSFSFEGQCEEGIVAASNLVAGNLNQPNAFSASEAYNHIKSAKEANNEAGGMRYVNIQIEGKTKFEDESSENVVCRQLKIDCISDTYTTAGDWLSQEIHHLYLPDDKTCEGGGPETFRMGQSNNMLKGFADKKIEGETKKFPPSIDKDLPGQPRNSLPSRTSAAVLLDKMEATIKEDQAGLHHRPSGNVQFDDEENSILELVGCYIHPLPIMSVWLSTNGSEIHICVLCGLEVDKVKTLFLYKLENEDPRAGRPLFVGHTTVTFPAQQDIFGRRFAPEISCLQFTPDREGLVLLGCMEAPHCRERSIKCSCPTCESISFDESAVRIVQANLGYVTVKANLKAAHRIWSILVCEPNYLAAIGESGRIHLWVMNQAWSAQREEFVMPTTDCISPGIVELKKIPKQANMLIGHNGLGEFSLWDISERVFLSKFSDPNPSICRFLPFSLLRWKTPSFMSGKCNYAEHVDAIMHATTAGFSGFLEIDENRACHNIEEEDIAVWLLVAAVSDIEDDYSSNACQTDSIVTWRLALLMKSMVIFGNTLDQRCWSQKATSLAVQSGYGIIGAIDGSIYVWELSTGRKIQTLHHLKGGSISCIATDHSNPAIMAAAGDGGKLLVYRQFE